MHAWRVGPSVAMGKLVDGALRLMALLTEPDQRGQGHGRRLLGGLAALPGVETLRMISIVPEEVAGGFLDACGIPRAEIVQYEMRLS